MATATSGTTDESRFEGIFAEMRTILKQGKQVWKLVRRKYRMALIGAALVMAICSTCNTAVPLLLGRLVDKVQAYINRTIGRHDVLMLAAWYLGFMAGAYMLREALNVARRYLVAVACSHIRQDMHVDLVSHLMTVRLSTISREKLGTLHGRISRNVEGIVRFLQVNFLDFFPAMFTGLFALAAVVNKQPILGLAMGGVIPVSMFLTARQIMSQKGVRLKLMRTYEEIDGAVVEQLSGIEYVRAADTHRHEMQRLSTATEMRRREEVRHNLHMAMFGSSKAVCEGLFHVLVLATAIYMAILGRITTGDVLTFSMLFLSVMAPMSELHRLLDEGHETSLLVGDLLELLAEPVDPSFATQDKQAAAALRNRPVIVAENLRVEYRTKQDQHRWALQGISLAIRHGETIGIAGRSGSGKTTFLKVLLRLVHPCDGKLLIGGMPVDAVSRAEIGRLFGYVGQSPFVFSGTITDNIAYGSKSISPVEIRRVAEMANLHEDICQMPGGYDAVISERGQNLSGGQRQRLALARVLLKQPPVLILDEATSALDNISERNVQRALGVASAERTTILVAHRLTTLRDADRIFVFDEGRIAEVGSYDELVAAGGVFNELVLSAESGVSPGVSPNRSIWQFDRALASSQELNGQAAPLHLSSAASSGKHARPVRPTGKAAGKRLLRTS
ncbi:MAG TPA: ABC transporter ATP-binding protein [Pirellulales bacterium]|jgi:ATP-binding cassette subfamily B protein|nr:ABC transporter ATP-binding protein [Pirellulales bacterium]